MSHRKKVTGDKHKKVKNDVKASEDINIASQLFEDTIELAQEEDAVKDAKQFAMFIVEMIPEDILNELKVLAGISNFDRIDDGNEGGNSASVAPESFLDSTLDRTTFLFLEDIWAERFREKLDDSDKGDWDRDTNSFECELCDRFIQTTRHHVYPKETHDWLRKRDESHYCTAELRKTIALCRMCHSAIHRFYSNRELATDYHSLDLLLDSDQVCKFAKWASSMQGRGNLRTR